MKRSSLAAIACVFALSAAACGGGSTAQPSGGTSGGSVPAASSGSAAPTKVTFVQAQDILSFAPSYVARAKGYLKDAGIDAEFDVVSGGAPVLEAISGGSAQLGLTAAADLINAGSKGVKAEAVYALDYETIDTVVSKKWADDHHVTRQSPIKDRALALKGSTIGYTTPGSISETLARYLLDWAGLNDKTDATYVGIGGLPARQAALKSGQIQVYLSSPPGPEQAEADGFGYVLIPAHDLPDFSHVINEVLIVNTDWAAKNGDTVRKVVAAMAQGTQLLQQSPDQALPLVKTFFPKESDAVLKQSLDSVDAALVPGGKASADDWKQSADLLVKIGAVKSSVDMSEGKYWTNQYLAAK